MATTFSGKTNEMYRISNFDQIVGIRSNNNKNLRVKILTFNEGSALIKSLQIYDELNAESVIVSLPYALTEASPDSYLNGLVPREDIIRILNAFGFNVEFGEKVRLSIKTLNFLKTLHNVGYRYLKFTDSGVYFYLSSLEDGQLGNKFTGFFDCDFSPLDTKEIYNIGHLIDKVTIK